MPIYVQKLDLLEQKTTNNVVEERHYMHLYVYNKDWPAGVITVHYNFRVSIHITIEVMQLLYPSMFVHTRERHNKLRYSVNGVEYLRWIDYAHPSSNWNTVVGKNKKTIVKKQEYSHKEIHTRSIAIIGSSEANQLIGDFVPFMDNDDSGFIDLLLDLQLG